MYRGTAFIYFLLMTRLFYLLITYTILIIPIEAQFGTVKIEFDDRLLRSDERYDLINLKEDIRQFFINTAWDKEYTDLNIPLHIQIILYGRQFCTARGCDGTICFMCTELFPKRKKKVITNKA